MNSATVRRIRRMALDWQQPRALNRPANSKDAIIRQMTKDLLLLADEVDRLAMRQQRAMAVLGRSD